MLDEISSSYFVDFSSVSNHKSLVVYCKIKNYHRWIIFITKKKKFFFLRWDRYKCLEFNLEFKKEICDHNKFEILSEELGNGELSADYIVEKFINTTNFHC